MKHKNIGFTLIELIIVIVILGILAVVAAPKFIDISGDARQARLEAMGGAMLSAANIVYAKAIIQGVQNLEEGSVDLDGDGTDDISVIYGYPSDNPRTSGATLVGLPAVMDGSFALEWAYAFSPREGAIWVTSAEDVGFSGYTNNNIPFSQLGCYLRYIPSDTIGESPAITFSNSSC